MVISTDAILRGPVWDNILERLKGTIFENHEISITEWIEFLLDIFNYVSTSLTSKENKNKQDSRSFVLHRPAYRIFIWSVNGLCQLLQQYERRADNRFRCCRKGSRELYSVV